MMVESIACLLTETGDAGSIPHWVTQKNVPCFLNIYIYRLNWDISNLFAVEDPLIHVLLLANI